MSIKKTTIKSLAIIAIASLTLTSCETDKESISDQDSLTINTESELTYSESYSLWIKNQWGSNFYSDNYDGPKSTDGDITTWSAIHPDGYITYQFMNTKVIDGLFFRLRNAKETYKFKVRAYNPDTKSWSEWKITGDTAGGTWTTLEAPNWWGDRIQIKPVSTSFSDGYGHLNIEEMEIYGYTLK